MDQALTHKMGLEVANKIVMSLSWWNAVFKLLIDHH